MGGCGRERSDERTEVEEGDNDELILGLLSKYQHKTGGVRFALTKTATRFDPRYRPAWRSLYESARHSCQTADNDFL